MLVAQSCPTLCDSMDCSLPGSSVHGIFQARVPEWVTYHSLLQGIFLTQGLNPGLLHCRQTLYPLSHQGSCCALDQRLKLLQSLRGRNLSQQVWLSGISLLMGWRWEEAHRSPGSRSTPGEHSGLRFSTAVSQTDRDYQEITAPLIGFQLGEVI